MPFLLIKIVSTFFFTFFIVFKGLQHSQLEWKSFFNDKESLNLIYLSLTKLERFKDLHNFYLGQGETKEIHFTTELWKLAQKHLERAILTPGSSLCHSAVLHIFAMMWFQSSVVEADLEGDSQHFIFFWLPFKQLIEIVGGYVPNVKL